MHERKRLLLDFVDEGDFVLFFPSFHRTFGAVGLVRLRVDRRARGYDLVACAVHPCQTLRLRTIFQCWDQLARLFELNLLLLVVLPHGELGLHVCVDFAFFVREGASWQLLLVLRFWRTPPFDAQQS